MDDTCQTKAHTVLDQRALAQAAKPNVVVQVDHARRQLLIARVLQPLTLLANIGQVGPALTIHDPAAALRWVPGGRHVKNCSYFSLKPAPVAQTDGARASECEDFVLALDAGGAAALNDDFILRLRSIEV
jgi:hypothetical protein